MSPPWHRLLLHLKRLVRASVVGTSRRHYCQSARVEGPKPTLLGTPAVHTSTPAHTPTPATSPTPAATHATLVVNPDTPTIATPTPSLDPTPPIPLPSLRPTPPTSIPSPIHTPTPTMTLPCPNVVPKDSAASHCPLVPKNFSWLLQHCPAFPVDGSKVRVVTSPGEFYEELVTRTRCASRRITMSSLYLGTGHLEDKLVATMMERCESCPGLRVQWLLDHTRGSRGQHNSRSMLRPLLHTFPDTCTVSLYHTPDLRGLLRWMIPQRWNEVIGLQHMKLYVFDDSLVISGANLSNDYFTNRQDRYLVFEDCPALANFCHNVVSTVADFSLQLQADDSTAMPAHTSVHPYLGDYKKYCGALREALAQLWRRECEQTTARLAQVTPDVTASPSDLGTDHQRLQEQQPREQHDLPQGPMSSYRREDNTLLGHLENQTVTSLDRQPDKSLDTVVFPTLQMGPFGITNDSVVTNKLLATAERESRIQLASGYFNLTEEYKKCILHGSLASYNILMAHPKANGFLGAQGFAGAIPAAYTQLAKGFLSRVVGGGQGGRVSMQEYLRAGWTFHAKGLWYYAPGHSLPSLTMIGSPNFGWRSVNRDLETQVLVFTRNPSLRASFHQEQAGLYAGAEQVTRDTFLAPDRHVPLWVRCVMPIIKIFF